MMEPENIKIIVIGIFVAGIAVYFSTQDNFEVILITISFELPPCEQDVVTVTLLTPIPIAVILKTVMFD